MKRIAIAEQIRQYITEASLSDKDSIKDETLIFEQGLLDSMGLLFLVQFLKDEFMIETSDHELERENFESINAIASFVNKKLENQDISSKVLE